MRKLRNVRNVRFLKFALFAEIAEIAIADKHHTGRIVALTILVILVEGR